MKARFFALMALVLGIVSCQTEPEGLNVNVGGEVDAVITVNIPETDTRARTAGSDSAEGAFANGVLGTESDNTTMRYILQIYNEAGTASNERLVEYSDGKSVSFNVRLVPGRDYQFVVWADVVADGKNDTDNHYNTSDLKNITLVDGKWKAMDESRDAFTATKLVEEYTGQQGINITLYRPFSKLRIVTTDTEAVDNLGIKPTTAKVTYETAHRVAFNAYTGKAAAASENNVKHTYVIASYGETFPGEEYTLFTDYFFAGDELEPVKFNFKSYDANGVVIKEVSFTNDIPVKRNNLTTIVGNFLTTGDVVNVKIEDAFDAEIGEDEGKRFAIVSNAEEFNEAFASSYIDLIILEDNIVLDSSLTRATTDPVLTVSAGKELTIDLGGKTLSATSANTGKNYNMFDVRGTLNVKNGTIEYEHTGDNMAWNNFAEIFYVGFNGTLNLDGVTAKNLGGSDMAYVIDMVNATNITVNVNNSTLESTYIPIRVFNNNKTGVHNVTIKSSTLKGKKYCFWTQYYLAEGRDQATLDQTLNYNIYNSESGESNNNTFDCTNDFENAPVLFGFNEYAYFDQYGNQISLLEDIIVDGVKLEGVGLDKDDNYVVTADEGMVSIATLIAADDDGFAGETIVLDADVNLAEVKTMGDSFAPIGSTGERDDRNRLVCKPFKGTFDGNGHAIKNIYQSGWDMGYEWGQYGSLGLFAVLEGATVKNIVIEGLEAQVEGGDISFIAGSATGDCVFENIEIKNSKIGTYNNGIGAIIGWSGAGNYTFKNIKIGSDVVIGGLWGSFDQSCGGVVGQAEVGASYHFEDVEISCRLDVYNDVTAAYKYYLYRMSGMIIGRCEATTTIDGRNYPDLSQYNITCKNVTVNYGDWMNYHYCVVEGKTAWRVEPGYAYGGIPADHDHSTCAMHHDLLLPFDALFGGDQYGVNPIKEYPGVTVNYPASYVTGE